MKKIITKIPGLYIIENEFIFQDERGVFLESWNKKYFEKINLSSNFKQDNISISKKNVLRGLHIQTSPESQLKLVQVIKGSVLDVIVDLRYNSPTFGEHIKFILNSKERKMIYIPEGLAHGFLSLENNTIFSYKCNKYYNPKHDITIKWSDPDLNINWEIKNPIISKKDKKGISLKDYLNIIKIQ